jgi:hypothetical protein
MPGEPRYVHRQRAAGRKALDPLLHLRPTLRRYRRRQPAPQQHREPHEPAHPLLLGHDLPVGRIAPEELVGPLARQHHWHALAARELADEVQRDADGIGERLVLVVHEAGQEVDGRLLRDGDLVVIRTELAGDAPRVRALVELWVAVEADGERGQPGRPIAQQGDERRRVEPAAEQDAHRHVRDQPVARGALHQPAHRAARLPRGQVAEATRREEVPVALGAQAAAVADRQGAGRQLVDPAVERLRWGGHEVGEIRRDRRLIDCRRDQRVLE